MKKKVICIFVMMLFIATAVLQVEAIKKESSKNVEEDFIKINDDWPPEGWTETVYSGTGHWEKRAVSGDYKDPAGASGFYAIADSDTHNTDIFDVGFFSPSFDLSDVTDTVTFECGVSFKKWVGNDMACIRVHSDEGLEEELVCFEGDYTDVFSTELNYNSYNSKKDIRIEFYYTTGEDVYCWFFSFDNVLVRRHQGGPIILGEDFDDDGEEGIYLYSAFQPVQTVYLNDSLYGNDLINEVPCIFDANVSMIAGKNTYIMGGTYVDRHHIYMSVYNDYDETIFFNIVMKIMPEDEEIWRSELRGLLPNSDFCWQEDAPLTESFQWENKFWGVRTGSIVLYLDVLNPPEKEDTSTNSYKTLDTECSQIVVNVELRDKKPLSVLFIPFTFTGGPPIPNNLLGPTHFGEFSIGGPPIENDFDRYLQNDLRPWWNAVYPLPENSLGLIRLAENGIKQNITVDGKIVSNLSTFQDLTGSQVNQVWNEIMNTNINSLISALPGHHTSYDFDRIIWLVDPALLVHPDDGAVDGCAPEFGGRSVIMNWSSWDCVPAHEVGHSYGLVDNYVYDENTDQITYVGDNATGYWVNQNIDVPTSAIDFMGDVHAIYNNQGEKAWIKKPNYKILIEELKDWKGMQGSENNINQDDKVIRVSGFIDKNDNVRLNPWYIQEEGRVDLEWGGTGEYLIEAYNKNNQLIAETGFNISFDYFADYINKITFDEALFGYQVTYDESMYKIEIVNNNNAQVIASRIKSEHTPQITITSPNKDEKIKSKPYKISWIGEDGDGDELTYYVSITNTSEEFYRPLNFGVKDNSWTADFTHFEPNDYKLKVSATDGWNVGESIVDIKITENKAKTINTPLLKFLENYPILYQIIQRFLRI